MSPARRKPPLKVPPPKAERPVPPPLVTLTPSTGATGAAGIRVVVVWRRSLSSQRQEREVDWPAGWRLPQAGDSIRLADGEGGFVEYIDFDLERRAMRVNVR